ncbi:carbohydrate-binding module family 21 protein [Collybiopsis luxurians FD-317 M1]|uniref:Carbohydrate-binding module family 21 protein n=1 Tax=Collybiopsis luxurians FD-317 M1 TaxID=944289 RepID=A0A0D0CKS9_9AGAR|nr:carbohydrate-binding module family 21 protein [Collybiopsis luxurians FD-317 M1]
MTTTMLAPLPSLSSISLSSSASLSSNTAGSPLPIIPRRNSSTQRSSASGFTSPPKVTPSPVRITVQRATPPSSNAASTSGNDSDSASSSSSSSQLSPARPKFHRGSRTVGAFPAESTSPTLGVHCSKKEFHSKGKDSKATASQAVPLKLSLEGLPAKKYPAQTRSEMLVEFPSVEPTHKSAPVPPLLVVRKKSGQLVKSSLKSRSAFKGSLSVMPGGLSSKSEPTTPTVTKAVKFDSQLEHVKLFLAEQRPLAVSRDGSPTDDTSGTESDFPSFIFGDKKSTVLKMTLTNMPPSLNLNTDIVLEEMKLALDGISIVGRIRVRNLSFQKWVAVRFTFDDWQTTSEVTAKYVQSQDSNFDVFGFSIKLNDLMARIEEKTLVLALRYNTDGREMWDNNFGRNYVATFTKEAPKQEQQKVNVSRRTDRDISSGSDISDLHSRLEQVVRKRDDKGTATSVPPHARLNLTSPDSQTVSLASRYDFSDSFKNAPKSSSAFSSRDHTRTHSYPLVTSASHGSFTWLEMPKKRRSVVKDKPVPNLGSPRDIEDTDSFRPAPFVPSDAEDGSDRESVARNHQRGYFDIGVMGSSSNVKMTPPGTPRSRTVDDTTPLASPRFHSLPSIRPSSSFRLPGLGFALSPKDAALVEANDGSSSLLSPPLSNDPTPTGSPTFVLTPTESVSPATNYDQFLDRFCFFTGSESSSGNSSDESPSESVSRSSSTSSMDGFLTSSSPRVYDSALHLFSSQPVTQTRDDICVRIRSGTSLEDSDSRSVTPVPR